MDVLRTAILDRVRRMKGKGFSPADVVKQMYPEDWRIFLPEVYSEMMEMYRENLIAVHQDGKPIHPNSKPEGEVIIRLPAKLK